MIISRIKITIPGIAISTISSDLNKSKQNIYQHSKGIYNQVSREDLNTQKSKLLSRSSRREMRQGVVFSLINRAISGLSLGEERKRRAFTP